MFNFSRRFLYTLSSKIGRKNPEKKFVVNFAKAEKSPFDIKSESSFNAYLSNGSLALDLKKPNCIAWVEIPEHEYGDHVIEAKIRLDSCGGYASAGLMFHIADEGSYYLALVSGKGYFRLDVVKDNSPRSLIAWTEVSGFDGTNIKFDIITCGTYLIFLVNGKWVGEVSDDTIHSGRLGFVAASYETSGADASGTDTSGTDASDEDTSDTDECTCKAWLDFFAVDTRISAIEENYKKWNDDMNINADSRLHLAETFAVMGKPSRALEQINRAWKRREEAARSVSATYTETRTKKELLLATRMAIRTGQYLEAEEFIDVILEQGTASAEGKEAVSEKIKVLNELDKFAELKNFMLKYTDTINKDVDFFSLLGRCCWKLNEYEDSAAAWESAFKLDTENGVYAANAAGMLELADKKDEALALFLEAGKIFLRQDNQAELEVVIPKLVRLGEKNWEARAIAGKWAFSIEDYDRCESEFIAAEKIRRGLRPRPKIDPALCYLWGLVFSLRGKHTDAVRMLERAVRLAPDYGLFRFKLAEVKLTGGEKDPKTAEELRLALEHMGDDHDGKMANLAGTLLLNAGDAENAEYFFDRARNVNN
ncbi:MAG: hypothetical protein LBG91_00695 [Treponema sp.]|jgi:tetratricopeptide (TPR) repeat protein|nr:hypothetical protein [Treponema sp.]